MRSFTNEQRSMFLRFVWGRSRLPPGPEFPRKFIIQPFPQEGNPDSYLPAARK
jgi:hypothetical protein